MMSWNVSTRSSVASPALRPRFATVAAVALGGMLGAAARVLLPWPSMFIDQLAHIDPLPIAIINLLGAMTLGLVSGYFSLRSWPEPIVKGITTGLLGSFTTMSALALVVVGVTLSSNVSVDQSPNQTILVVAAVTTGLVVFLWVTTRLTILAYRGGVRLAGDAA